MSDFKLGVVIASVREGRGGGAVAEWFLDIARRHAAFEVETIDLKEVDLPVFHARNHPRLRQYEDEKTKAWSATVAATDAFVFVTPEYNYSTPPALLNALDHLLFEWQYKAVGFVSYGGISGGMRALQMTRQIVTGFKMVPILEAVMFPSYTKLVDAATGRFEGGETGEKAANLMLGELARWTKALVTLRT